MLSILEVLRLPIEKEKSSDETKQVPNLPLVFNSLCPLLKYHIQPDPSTGEVDLNIVQEYERVCESIATTLSIIASEGVQEIKD